MNDPDEMTCRDAHGVTHFVHATPPNIDILEAVCGQLVPYTFEQISDSRTDVVTCLRCSAPTRKYIRPPFGPDDPRGHLYRALLA